LHVIDIVYFMSNSGSFSNEAVDRGALQGGINMNTKELNAFTARWLMALRTAQADGNRKTVRIIVDALARAHEIPAAYPPHH